MKDKKKVQLKYYCESIFLLDYFWFYKISSCFDDDDDNDNNSTQRYRF